MTNPAQDAKNHAVWQTTRSIAETRTESRTNVLPDKCGFFVLDSQMPEEITLGSSNHTQPPIPNAVCIALKIITPPADYFLERTRSCSPFVSIPLINLAHKILKNYLEAELEG